MPNDLEDFDSRKQVTLKSREVARFHRGDVYVSVQAGGAGYGDPLERDSASVLTDIVQGACSLEMARQVYGVEINTDAMAVVEDQTAALRERVRSQRLAGSSNGNGPVASLDGEHPLLLVGDAVKMNNGGKTDWSCQRCGHRLGAADQDFRLHAKVEEVGIDSYCPWNRYAWVDTFVLRQFSCPGCGVLLDVQSRRKNDSTLYDAISVPLVAGGR
jgi:N-methylhydantoinase B